MPEDPARSHDEIRRQLEEQRRLERVFAERNAALPRPYDGGEIPNDPLTGDAALYKALIAAHSDTADFALAMARTGVVGVVLLALAARANPFGTVWTTLLTISLVCAYEILELVINRRRRRATVEAVSELQRKVESRSPSRK